MVPGLGPFPGRGSRRAGRRSPEPGLRLGVAIGPDRLVAVEIARTLTGLRPARVHTAPLAHPGEDASWPDLAAAFKELLAGAGAKGGEVSVALLRPLAHAKVVALPPARRRELRTLVTRGARRYFVIGAGPVVADAVKLGRPADRSLTPSLAVCSSEDRVETILRAAVEAGLVPGAVTAAPLALVSAVCGLSRTARHTPLIIITTGESVEGIVVHRGLPRLFQPWRPRSAAERHELVSRLVDAARATLGQAGQGLRALVLGPPDERAPFAADFAELQVQEAVLEDRTLFDLEPAALAAFGAALTPEVAPLLAPERHRRELQRRIHRRLGMILGTAALLLGAAAGLHLWGLQRKLAAVTEARGTLAADVAKAVALQRTLAAVRGRLETISRLDAAAPRWVETFGALARALPDSAYLISFSATGGEIRLEGVATTASSVVPALQASALFTNVTLRTALRTDDGRDAEAFQLALALAPRVPADREREP